MMKTDEAIRAGALRESCEGDIEMNVLCYEDKLVAIQPADRLDNEQLKLCLELQRAIGREVIFELVW